MKASLASGPRRLDVVAGLIDGMLTALTLSAGKLLHAGGALSLGLVGRVAAASAATTVFVFFVAHYADLVRAERELNLLSHGKLATTALGREVFRESLLGGIVASVCSLFGAAIPLLLAVLMPNMPFLSLGFAILLLGLLGASLAWSLYGSPLKWAFGMMAGGIILTLVGIKLDIVG